MVNGLGNIPFASIVLLTNALRIGNEPALMYSLLDGIALAAGSVKFSPMQYQTNALVM